MAALVTRRNRATLPVGRAIHAPEWRALGLQSLTLFQTTDVEVGPTPSGLTRSGTGFTPKAGASLGMGVSQAGGNNLWGVTAPGRIIGSGNQFAVVLAFQLNATGQTSRYLAIEGASTTQTAIIYGYTANTVEFFAQGYSGADPRSGSGIVVNDTLPHVIVYSYDGTMWRGFLDGVEKFAVARTFSLAASQQFVGYIGGAAPSTGVVNATYFLHARFSSGLPRAAALRLSGSVSQLFKSAPRRVWAPAITAPVSGATLSAETTTRSTADASLSTSVQMAASATTASAAGASLATNGAPWSASSSTPSAASASLSTSVVLSASSSTPSNAAAALLTASTWGASSATTCSAGAALATSITLAAQAITRAQATAALTTAVALAASSSTPSSATGDVSTSGAQWGASSTTPARAAGALVTSIRLAASTSTRSSAGAFLQIGQTIPVNPARVLELAPSNRVLEMTAENRVLEMSAENRILEI